MFDGLEKNYPIKYLLQISLLKLNILTISMEYGAVPRYELHTKPVPVIIILLLVEGI